LSDAPPHAPRALAIPRSTPASDELAEVIDLVQLPHGARPTPLAYIDWEEVPRLRVLDCESYRRCLGFVSRVRWKSFHCRQCPRNPARSGEEAPPAPAGALVDLEP
jgi:hypothetical protein